MSTVVTPEKIEQIRLEIQAVIKEEWCGNGMVRERAVWRIAHMAAGAFSEMGNALASASIWGATKMDRRDDPQ